jgi:hypothetical protein
MKYKEKEIIFRGISDLITNLHDLNPIANKTSIHNYLKRSPLSRA